MKNSITASSITSEKSVMDAAKNNPIFGFYDELSTSSNSLTRYSESRFEQSQISKVAQWFLAKESMSHKKLEKLCYYVGPVDKSKKSAGTHSGSIRIINWEIAKDGILPSA